MLLALWLTLAELLILTAVSHPLECYVGDSLSHTMIETKCPGSWHDSCYTAECPDKGSVQKFCAATNTQDQTKADFLVNCPGGTVSFCDTDKCNS